MILTWSDVLGVFYKIWVKDEFMYSMLSNIDYIAFWFNFQKDYSFNSELYNLKRMHLATLQIIYV